MTTYRELEIQIIRWAEARRIIPLAKPHTQLLKAMSELGELADAELKDDTAEIRDSLGDVLVCLINYAALKDVDLVQCLEGAWQQIKDRKGYLTEDGTFVKESA